MLKLKYLIGEKQFSFLVQTFDRGSVTFDLNLKSIKRDLNQLG